MKVSYYLRVLIWCRMAYIIYVKQWGNIYRDNVSVKMGFLKLESNNSAKNIHIFCKMRMLTGVETGKQSIVLI